MDFVFFIATFLITLTLGDLKNDETRIKKRPIGKI